MAHAEVERAGLLNDDVPEQVLATVARWCDGAATVAEVRAARRAVYVRRKARPHVPTRVLQGLAWDLAAYVAGGPGLQRARYLASALNTAACCLCWAGEPKATAMLRVEALYASVLAKAARQGGE